MRTTLIRGTWEQERKLKGGLGAKKQHEERNEKTEGVLFNGGRFIPKNYILTSAKGKRFLVKEKKQNQTRLK